jgi:hypothetical protein
MEFSIEKSVSAIPVDKIKVFSNKKITLSNPYDFINISDSFSYADYSEFLIKGLNEHIDTTHVLVTQYDGFGVNRKYWKDQYLEYDFIGPPTSLSYSPIKSLLEECNIVKTGWFVGGGGFSLRSKKLLLALQDPAISTQFYNYKWNDYWHSEDVTICIIYKDYLEKEHGIRFAPVELAIDFGAEYLTGYSACLGFHGYENIPFFLTEQECTYYLQNLKMNYHSPKTNKLIGNLYSKNYGTVLNLPSIKNKISSVFTYDYS